MRSLFDLSIDQLEPEIDALCAKIAELPLEQRIEALNQVRQALHSISPFSSEPVDCVLWVQGEHVHANDYNPNAVAPPEMRLLERSVEEDGFTQPVVGFENGGYEVVDGFHRTRVAKECKRINKRLHGYVPITIINAGRTDRKDRMAATIRHNRARGVHAVLPMRDIVASLIRLGWNDVEIAKELGMDADEVLRFKQTTGLIDLFREHQYSRSWE